MRVHTLLETLERTSTTQPDALVEVTEAEVEQEVEKSEKLPPPDSKHHPGTPRTMARGRVRTAAGPPVVVNAPSKFERPREALLTLTDFWDGPSDCEAK